MVPSIKIVTSPLLQPKAVPDGTSLQELVNSYLSAFNPTNVLDIKLFRQPEGNDNVMIITTQA